MLKQALGIVTLYTKGPTSQESVHWPGSLVLAKPIKQENFVSFAWKRSEWPHVSGAFARKVAKMCLILA
jgi:hypothetical protein